MSDLLGLLDGEATFVTNTDGTVSLSPGTPITSGEGELAAVDQPLSATLHDDTDEVHAPTVVPGEVSVAAELVSDDDTIYAPDITTLASVVSEPYGDDTEVYAPSVEAIAQATADLHVDPDEVFAPTIDATAALEAALHDDADEFYVHSIEGEEPPEDQGLFPPLYTELAGAVSYLYGDDEVTHVTGADGTWFAPGAPLSLASGVAGVVVETFYAPALVFPQELSPSLHDDADIFYEPTVVPDQVLSADLFDDPDVFHPPIIVVEGGDQFLLAALVDDVDVFHAPSVVGEGAEQTLAPELHDDADEIYPPSVELGAGADQTLSPELHDDPDTFPVPTIGPESELPLVTGGDTIRRRPTRRPQWQRLQPELVPADDEVFVATVTLLPPVTVEPTQLPLPLELVSLLVDPRPPVSVRPRLDEPTSGELVGRTDSRPRGSDELTDEEIMLVLLEVL